MFSKCVKEINDLPNRFRQTDVIFSPDDRYVLTGTSVKRGAGQGHLKIFDRYTYDLVHDIRKLTFTLAIS
jgi:hypothetical protein